MGEAVSVRVGGNGVGEGAVTGRLHALSRRGKKSREVICFISSFYQNLAG